MKRSSHHNFCCIKRLLRRRSATQTALRAAIEVATPTIHDRISCPSRTSPKTSGPTPKFLASASIICCQFGGRVQGTSEETCTHMRHTMINKGWICMKIPKSIQNIYLNIYAKLYQPVKSSIPGSNPVDATRRRVRLWLLVTETKWTHRPGIVPYCRGSRWRYCSPAYIWTQASVCFQLKIRIILLFPGQGLREFPQ